MSENNSNVEVLADEMDFETPDHARQTLERVWHSVSDQHKRSAFVLVSAVLYTFLSIIAPLYSAHIIDLLWSNTKETVTIGAVSQVIWTTGGRDMVFLLLIYLAAALSRTLQSSLMSSFVERLSLRLRIEISRKLNRLPLSFSDHTKTGEILSRTVSDLDKASETLQTGMLKLFTTVGMIVGPLIIMFHSSILLTLVFLVFTGITLAATDFVSAKALKSALKWQQCVGNVTAQVEEAYSGRVIIRTFNQERNSSENVHKAMGELAEATKKTDFMINTVNPMTRLINRLNQMLIVVLTGKMLLEERLTVGVLQTFFQYANQASEPLTEAAYMVDNMQSALASLGRIYRLLDEEELSPESALPVVVEQAKGIVEFQNVRLGYMPDNILVHNTSFSVKPGQKVAIVGSTGTGKTTLINLLIQFYELSGGKITLDGTDTKDIPRSSLRSNFGMVLQDTWLFSNTAAENITYNKPDATREEIVAAAKTAKVDFFVRTMSYGYDTVLSNDTEDISVGQRQLLAIARMFLCDPAVIILDEATSSVDIHTEIEIGEAMRALIKNKASFVIAHRLSTIIDTDLILFMQGGNITEQGTHEALLKAKGAHADMHYSRLA